jgi:hypothetical protein
MRPKRRRAKDFGRNGSPIFFAAPLDFCRATVKDGCTDPGETTHLAFFFRPHERFAHMIRVLTGVVLSAAAMLVWAWACWNPLLNVVQDKGIIQPIQHVQAAGDAEVSQVAADSRFVMTYSQTLADQPQWVHWGVQFGQFVVVALAAALLLKMAGLQSYIGRVFFVVMLGVFASALIDPRSLLRGTESWELPAYASVFHIGCTLIMGLLLAAFTAPKQAAVRMHNGLR